MTCSGLFTLFSFLLLFLLWHQILDYNAPVNALVLSHDADSWSGVKHYTTYIDISSAIGVKHDGLQFIQYYNPSPMQQPSYNPYPPSGSYQPPTVSTPPIGPPITSNSPTISNQPSLNGPSGPTTAPQSQPQQQVQQTPSLTMQSPPIGSPPGAPPSMSNTTTTPSAAGTFPDTSITSVLDGNNASLLLSQQNQNNNSTTTSSDKIAFTFAGTDSVGIAGFECSLDTPLPSPTSSPSVLASVFSTNNIFSCSNRVLISNLTSGSSHRFEVRAVDPSGNRDPSPASFSWTIANVNSGNTDKTNTIGNASVPGQQILNNSAATGRGNLTTRTTLSPPSSQQLMSAPVNTSISNQEQMNVSNTLNALKPGSARISESQKKEILFTAKLSGNNEVPIVSTAASGDAKFRSIDNSDGKKFLVYEINLKDIKGVMGAHIHQGKQGENGPVVAGLFNSNMSSPPTGDINGSLVKGANITSSDLQGPLVGKQLPDLITLINNGEAYVNIHTEKNQNGELRGEISLSPSQ